MVLRREKEKSALQTLPHPAFLLQRYPFGAVKYAAISVQEKNPPKSAPSARQKKTGLKKLCLGGGVVLNCVVNARILKESGFTGVMPDSAEDIFILILDILIIDEGC